MIIEDLAVLRMIDSHLLNGSVKHKILALKLLDNLILNTLDDALKIVKDLGILRRLFECVSLRKDATITVEANRVLFCICLRISEVEQPRQTELFDGLLKLRCPELGETTFMELLVKNLAQENSKSHSDVVQIFTLKILQLLFTCQPENYTLVFDCY